MDALSGRPPPSIYPQCGPYGRNGVLTLPPPGLRQVGQK